MSKSNTRNSRPARPVNITAAMASMVVMVAVMEVDLTVTGIMVKDLTVIDHMVTEVEIAQVLTVVAEAEVEAMEVTTRQPLLVAQSHHQHNLLVQEVPPMTMPPNTHSIMGVRTPMPHTADTQRKFTRNLAML